MGQNFGLKKYELRVVDGRALDGFSQMGDIVSGVYVFIYDAGTKTLSTVYGDFASAAKTNPITRSQFATDGKLVFYGLATSYDIFIADSLGNVAFYDAVTPNTHVLPLARTGVDKMMVVPFLFNAGATEVDTAVDFPVNSIIHPPFVEVVTIDATETLHVGLLSTETAGDADGLLVAVALGVAGFIRPWIITDGANEDFVATPYLGVLIGLGSAGTDAANDFGQSGGHGHIVTGSNAKSLSYTPSTSDTAAGYIYVPFKILR